MTTWRRAHEPGRRRLMVASAAIYSVLVWLVFGGYAIAILVVRPHPIALLPLALGAFMQAFAARFALAGVDVGVAGIRVRGLWRTRVIAWDDVHRVLVAQTPGHPNEAAVVVTRDGTRLPILWKRYRLAQAPDETVGLTVRPQVVDQLAADLDAWAAAYRSQAPTTGGEHP